MPEIRSSPMDAFGLYLQDVKTDNEPIIDKLEKQAEIMKIIEAGIYAEHLLETETYGDRDPELLAELVAEGDAARDKFIRANLRLAINIAKNRYLTIPSGRLGVADVLQAANEKLVHAVSKFDYKKGYMFSTYATFWIKQGTNYHIDGEHYLNDLPRRMQEDTRRINAFRSNFAAETGYEMTLEEIAEEFDLELSYVEDLMVYMKRNPIYLDKPLDSGDANLGDFIYDRVESLDAIVERGELPQLVKEVLRCLTETQAKYLVMRFGLDGREPMTFEAIGKEFKVTRNAVGVVVNVALKKIKKLYPELEELM